MSKQLNNMINQLNVQLAIARNDSIIQQNKAAEMEARYQRQTAQYQSSFEQLQKQNTESAKQMQSAFAKQLAASEKASASTIAGLESLLIDQQANAKAQADAFAKQTAQAEANFQAQLKQQQRIANAYIPDAEATATAPLIGDQKLDKTKVKQSSLSALSIISNPNAGVGGASQGQAANQLSGLQIA